MEKEGMKSPYFLIYVGLMFVGVMLWVSSFMVTTAMDRVATAIERIK